MAKQNKKPSRKKSNRKNKKSNLKIKFISLLFILILGSIVYWIDNLPEIPQQQEQEVAPQTLKKAALKTAIHDKIRVHTYLDFDDKSTARFWWNHYFKLTDWNPDGYFWDMYSNNKHSDYLGGKVQNREHCMPRSWWGKRENYTSFDANGDLHNLYPADYAANAAKSNLPLGEVGITKFDNGVSKVGKNTYPNGYKGQVFEPADEYKGDFARIYFYMITCYEDYSYNWRSSATQSMLSKGPYPGFQPWALAMLLKWHRNDPVSEKETNRNEEVFKIQGNKNPFIDNPELVEYIWGNKMDETFLLDNNIIVSTQNKTNKKNTNYIEFIADWIKECTH